MALYWTNVIVVMGFITNRINVSITGLERVTHAGYSPKWPELAVTLMLTTCAVLVFRYAVLYLGHPAAHCSGEAAQVACQRRRGGQRLILRRARSAPEPHPSKPKTVAGGPGTRAGGGRRRSANLLIAGFPCFTSDLPLRHSARINL